MKTVSILLVEDDDIDAMGVERAFKKARIANPIVRAHDGVEALEALRNQRMSSPYLILLDLNMPRMNGLEFLAEVRADPSLHKALIFVLTTSSSDEDIARAYQQHIAGYVVKSSLDQDFTQLLGLLDYYWRMIEFPD